MRSERKVAQAVFREGRGEREGGKGKWVGQLVHPVKRHDASLSPDYAVRCPRMGGGEFARWFLVPARSSGSSSCIGS